MLYIQRREFVWVMIGTSGGLLWIQ